MFPPWNESCALRSGMFRRRQRPVGGPPSLSRPPEAAAAGPGARGPHHHRHTVWCQHSTAGTAVAHRRCCRPWVLAAVEAPVIWAEVSLTGLGEAGVEGAGHDSRGAAVAPAGRFRHNRTLISRPSEEEWRTPRWLPGLCPRNGRLSAAAGRPHPSVSRGTVPWRGQPRPPGNNGPEKSGPETSNPETSNPAISPLFAPAVVKASPQDTVQGPCFSPPPRGPCPFARRVLSWFCGPVTAPSQRAGFGAALSRAAQEPGIPGPQRRCICRGARVPAHLNLNQEELHEQPGGTSNGGSATPHRAAEGKEGPGEDLWVLPEGGGRRPDRMSWPGRAASHFQLPGVPGQVGRRPAAHGTVGIRCAVDELRPCPDCISRPPAGGSRPGVLRRLPGQ